MCPACAGKQRDSPRSERAFPFWSTSISSLELQILFFLAIKWTPKQNASAGFAAMDEGSHTSLSLKKGLYQDIEVGFQQSFLLSGTDMINPSSGGAGLALPSSLQHRHHRPHSDYKEGFAALAVWRKTLTLLSFHCQQTPDNETEHKTATPAWRLNGTGRIKEEKRLFTLISGSRKAQSMAGHCTPWTNSCMTAGKWIAASSHFLLDQLSQPILSPSWQF